MKKQSTVYHNHELISVKYHTTIKPDVTVSFQSKMNLLPRGGVPFYFSHKPSELEGDGKPGPL